MTLLAMVFPDGLNVNLTRCSECPNGHILPGVTAAHGRLKDLLPGHAVGLIRHGDELEFRAPSITRREFFLFFRERSTRAAAAMAKRLKDNAERRSYGKKQLPITRSLLLKAMAASPATSDRTIGDRLFGKISFTSDCTRSERCVGVCPTGAIGSSRRDGNPPLFDHTLCVSCFSCQAFCRNRGVVVSGSDRTPSHGEEMSADRKGR